MRRRNCYQSITSSARSRNASDIVRFRAFAVLRLMANFTHRLVGIAADPYNIKHDIPTLDQADLAAALSERLHERLIILVVGRAKRQEAKSDRFGILRARRERPRRRRAAEQRDELAAFQAHSITSSARPSTAMG